MGIDGGIPDDSGEVFAFSVGDVFTVSLDVPFGKIKALKEDLMTVFVGPEAEAIG